MTRALLLCVAALFLLAPASHAQLPVGGVASDNVEFVKNFVRHTDTAGARLLDGYFYITTERDLSIYDLKDPENPVMVGNALLDTPGQPAFTEEDPDTNGKILIVSNTDTLVYDVSDKTAPTLLGRVAGVDEHTMSCILECTWVYGSEGVILDLRDPAHPKEAGNWREGLDPATTSTHDVTEVAPGLVLTATEPMLLLDARNDPAHPKVLATGKPPGFLHATQWPQGGADDFILAGGEEVGPGCSDDQDTGSASFMTFATPGWQTSKEFKLLSEFRMTTGTVVDGRSPETTWCVHWFDKHPAFANGGMLAIAWYEHGTRFLSVSPEGKIEEIGYFLPYAGQTSAVYWVNERILYTADYYRGFDILRFTGDIPRGNPHAPGPAMSPAGPPMPGPATKAGPSFDDLVSLPRRCTSARAFRVKIRRHTADPVASATLRVDGRRVSRARGTALRKGLRAKRLPRRRFSIQVEVTTRSGHKTAGQHRYAGCKRR
jgi:hypothetical protein